jgi:hypothetical protein
MAEQNDKNYQDGKENDSFDDELKKMLAVNFDDTTESDEPPVTKIYVAGTEYNSVDEIPPEVRDKMSETLLQVQQESSKAEDLSVVFKKQRKLRTGGMLFGDRADSYSPPSLNPGKMALAIIALVAVAVVIYLILIR